MIIIDCTIISDGAVDFSRDESADPDEIVCVHITSDDEDDEVDDVAEDEAEAADDRASVAGEDDAQPLDWSLIIEEAINNHNNNYNDNNSDMLKAMSTSKRFTERKKSFSPKEMLNDSPVVIDRVGWHDGPSN